MCSVTIRLRKETVERLRAESKKRNPKSKRAAIGFLIDELVDRYLADKGKK
jgi:predicted DNA-binding protein